MANVPPPRQPLRVQGTATAAFAGVQRLFEQQMQSMAEHQAQLCVYHRGEVVVDLWAAPETDTSFNADSLINIFSSGKSLEAVALAWLVDRGLLDYDAAIADYWAAYADRGKQSTTVADLMRHEAGLANLQQSLRIEDLTRDALKTNAVGRIIEQQAPYYAAGGRRAYHALSRGWIANELFRRVDPAGRTIGEFLAEDVCAPLQADVMIGVPEAALARIAPVHALPLTYHLRESLRPQRAGRAVVHDFGQLMRRVMAIAPSALKQPKPKPPPPFVGQRSLGVFNDPQFAMGETPSANAHASARGLARLAAMLAAKGRLADRQILRETAWQRLHAKSLEEPMGGMLTTRFTQGGVDVYQPCDARTPPLQRDLNAGREGFYGWMGLGGSIFQWHPQLQLGFAFVPTRLHVLDFLNERGKRYQAEVLRCVPPDSV